MIGFALLAILALFSPFVDAAKQLDYIVPEANAPLGEGLDHANLRTIELVSAPIKLRYGEVFNTWLPPIPLPEDVVKDYANRSMQIVDYRMSITDADGAPVPLYNTVSRARVRLSTIHPFLHPTDTHPSSTTTITPSSSARRTR